MTMQSPGNLYFKHQDEIKIAVDPQGNLLVAGCPVASPGQHSGLVFGSSAKAGPAVSVRENAPSAGDGALTADFVRTEVDPRPQTAPALLFAKAGTDQVEFTYDGEAGGARLKGKTVRVGDFEYEVGTGIFDITGPQYDAVMQGFAEDDQKVRGLHLRQYARAFVVVEKESHRHVAIVVADIWSCSQLMKMEVVKKLQATYGDKFGVANVLITGTHTHSAPGGFSHFDLYNFSAGGFDAEYFDTMVNGMVEAIKDADSNRVEGDILLNSGTLEGCGENRSIMAYAANPADERDGQPATDQEMVLLKFVSSTCQELGVLNWFPIHPTSLGQTNTYISGDSKGYASYLFEQEKGTDPNLASTFVAAFANSNCGDVSGNVRFGIPTGGKSDFDHMRLYGEMQREKARSLYDGPGLEKVTGPVDFRHTEVDMSNVADPDGERITWPAAFGYAFAAGSTEDGTPSLKQALRDSPIGVPVDVVLEEGVTKDQVANHPVLSEDKMQVTMTTLFSGQASSRLFAPRVFAPVTEEVALGHGKKPILFPVGLAIPPLAPSVVPLQLIRVGNLILTGIPAELTTMAGRRLRNDIQEVVQESGITRVILAAYSNGYSGYVTTREEYQAQHYEGASTLYGPETLQAYQLKFRALAGELVDGSGSREAQIRDFRSISFPPTVVFKTKPTHLSSASHIGSHAWQVGGDDWAGTEAMTALRDRLYAIQGNIFDGIRLWRIDPGTGTREDLGSGWGGTEATTALGNHLYAVQGGTLWRIDPSDGSFDDLGSRWDGTEAMTALGDRLYAIQGRKLWRINPSNGAFDDLGSGWGGTEAMTALGNRLYAVQGNVFDGIKLWRKDPNGGSDDLGSKWGGTEAMTALGNRLYAVQGGKLWRKDPNGGSDDLGSKWGGTLAMTALDGHLYAVQGGKLCKVTPIDRFGQVLLQPNSTYKRGETVTVSFVAATPFIDRKDDHTYMSVQINSANSRNPTWQTVYTDRDDCTLISWIKATHCDCFILTATWEIPAEAETGEYHIRHDGSFFEDSGETDSYRGSTSSFSVEA